MNADRIFSSMSGVKSCTCVKCKWENTHHDWFVVMWWQQTKPQTASVPTGVPVCFLFYFCPTMTLDLWNYCKGNSKSPHVPAPWLSPHTNVSCCQHLSLMVSGAWRMWRRGFHTGPFCPFYSCYSLETHSTFIQLDPLGFSWCEGVSGICLWEWQLEDCWRMLVDSP